jgi:hypothetical protein
MLRIRRRPATDDSGGKAAPPDGLLAGEAFDGGAQGADAQSPSA